MATREVVELCLDANPLTTSPVWTDITDYIAAPITITRGRSDELAEIQPSVLSTVLDNDSGKFTVGGPSAFAGLEFGNRIRVRTETNVSVPENPGLVDTFTRSVTDSWGTSETSHTYALSGGAAADFDVNGTKGTIAVTAANSGRNAVTDPASVRDCDITVTVESSAVALGDSQHVYLLGRYIDTSNWYGVRASFKTDQQIDLQFRKRTGGTEATIGTLITTPNTHSANTQYKMRFQVIDNALKAKFWLASNAEPSAWMLEATDSDHTAIGSVGVRAFLPTGNTNTLPVTFSWDNLSTKEVSRTRSWPRFDGFLNQLPVNWSGSAEAGTSVVPITATDVFKRLGAQGDLEGIFTEEVLFTSTTKASVAACYPLLSESYSDIIGKGAQPATVKIRGAGGGTADFIEAGPTVELDAVKFAPAGSTNGKYLEADLGQQFQDASTSGVLRTAVELWLRTTDTTRAKVLFALWDQSRSRVAEFYVESTDGFVYFHNEWEDGGTAITTLGSSNLQDGNWHHIVLAINPNFTSTAGQYTLYVDGSAQGSGSWLKGDGLANIRYLSWGGTKGTPWVSSVFVDQTFIGEVSHVAAYTGMTTTGVLEVVSHFSSAQTETGDARVARLLKYATGTVETIKAIGSPFSTVGNQTVVDKAAVAGMKEVEAAEGGVLISARDGDAGGLRNWLEFQSRGVRYNPLSAITMTTRQLAPSPDSEYDDQYLLNEYTVSRPGGGSFRVVDSASQAKFGRYNDEADLVKASDLELIDAGYWEISRRNAIHQRLGSLETNEHLLTEADYEDVLALDVSSVITVSGLPGVTSWTETATVFLEGYTETIRIGTDHKLEFTTSPSSGFVAFTLDDATLGKLDSGNQLAY